MNSGNRGIAPGMFTQPVTTDPMASTINGIPITAGALCKYLRTSRPGVRFCPWKVITSQRVM